MCREKDAEVVLERFEEGFRNSLLFRKVALDTTDASVEETLSECVRKMLPYITAKEGLRTLSRGIP